MKELFKDHINQQIEYVRLLLDKRNLDSLIIDSGMPNYYFQDDQIAPFKSNPHFLHFCPDTHPGHILQITKSEKPTLLYYSPDDFWHEVSIFESPFWADFFDVKIITDKRNLWSSLNIESGNHYCLTPQIEKINFKNVSLVDDAFLSALHWSRISKTEYEIHCLREANKKAALGHLAAKDSFFKGQSEREVYQNYLKASHQLQTELPYGNIIAFNEKAAILHYQNTRSLKNGSTFLIDAGATYNGYCSDITRTYFTEKAHPTFKAIHKSLELSQKDLCLMVKPDFDYQEIQDKAYQDITQILIENKIIINTNLDSAIDKNLASTFFPHGIGHGLGLQVHDVGGKQLNDQGVSCTENTKHPYLRTLRKIQNNDVLTIEPGLYFIPLLLKSLKNDSTKSSLIDWSLVEKLVPFGGLRIEDNIVARNKSLPENLTRPFLPN